MAATKHAAHTRACTQCGRALKGRQALYCSSKCRERTYRNPLKARTRWAEWYAANRERQLARVKAWKEGHRAHAAEYQRHWRNAGPCPFCPNNHHRGAASCRACARRYGCVCARNPECGVIGTHKHCPCGMPVRRQRTQYVIEACRFCSAEMKRLGVSLDELFLRSKDDEEDIAA